ncbi:MAG: glutaredoxin 3 [Polyangiaceae bacterium]|nr:glutaredoxin 3 [Polyangiaceae bacterium]
MASAEVVIYVTTYCPYCVRAKALLSKKDVPYQEVNVEERPDLRSWIAQKSGQRTVPQIFVNGRPLGGFSDIAALDQRGQLDPLLSRARTPEDPAVEV